MRHGIITTTKAVGNGLVFTQFCPLDINKGGLDVSVEGLIRGIVSAQWRDQQGEVLVQDGMDWSYADKYGVLNEDHDNSPGKVLGELGERWDTTYEPPNAPGTSVPATGLAARLYMGKPRAREAWETIKAQLESPWSKRRMGYSVEGSAIARDSGSPRVILKSAIINTALTQHPVFPGARLTSIAKSMGFLSVGEQTPADPGDGVYGALVGQDLEGAPDPVLDMAASLATSPRAQTMTARELAGVVGRYHPRLNKSQCLTVARAIMRIARSMPSTTPKER